MSGPTNDAGDVLRAGRGEPLLLFHGISCSARVWRPVVPRLALRHDVIVPTALGHRGGTRPSMRPVRIEHVVDDAERCLDRLGIARAHLAGSSMGGWVALELARRGRAASVCALSPAGMWDHERRGGSKLRKLFALTRAARPLLPLLAHSASFRRIAMRTNVERGHHLTRAQMLALVDDLLGCDVVSDLLGTQEALSKLEPDCPVTIAWSEHDRIFPVARHVPIAQRLVPRARFMVLKGVGHLPMFDDPQLVVDAILGAVADARVEVPVPLAGDSSEALLS